MSDPHPWMSMFSELAGSERRAERNAPVTAGSRAAMTLAGQLRDTLHLNSAEPSQLGEMFRANGEAAFNTAADAQPFLPPADRTRLLHALQAVLLERHPADAAAAAVAPPTSAGTF